MADSKFFFVDIEYDKDILKIGNNPDYQYFLELKVKNIDILTDVYCECYQKDKSINHNYIIIELLGGDYIEGFICNQKYDERLRKLIIYDLNYCDEFHNKSNLKTSARMITSILPKIIINKFR